VRDARLEAIAESGVFADVGGRLTSVVVKEGDRVVKGALLATLDDVEQQVALARATLSSQEAAAQVRDREVGLRQARRELQQSEKLSTTPQGSPLSQKEILTLREAVERAELQLEISRLQRETRTLELSEAQRRVDQMKITAPFAGIVSSTLNRKAGHLIGAGAEVVHLVDPSKLQARVRVPEREFTRLAAGAQASFVIPSFPGRRFRGRVDALNPVIEPETGTFVAMVVLDRDDLMSAIVKSASWGAVRDDAQPMPGMYATIEIVTQQHKGAKLVPKAAVVYEDGRPVVWKFTPDRERGEGRASSERTGTVNRVAISGLIGFSDYLNVEILGAALSATDEVVIVGQAGLREDGRVAVRE
jgi:RND family efflux transporter MFP subunit